MKYDVSQIFEDVRSTKKFIEDRGVKAPAIPRFQTIGDIKKFHDELIDIQVGLQNSAKKEPFKVPPPVPGITIGDTSITPLTSALALEREGKKMHHCVAGYDRMVEEGRSYIYHINCGEEPATLELATRMSAPTWSTGPRESIGLRLAQVQGYCNHTPSDELREAVETWCEKHNVDTTPPF